jgi:prepilin-type N-terminal cleavage/methylation domain-containing protein
VSIGIRAGRRGFTLVELLVVTVIIGIIAGMMMITMGATTESAKGVKVINDLRLIKTAAVAYFFEYDELPSEGLTIGTSGSAVLAASIDKFLDKPLHGHYDDGVFITKSGDKFLYGLSPDQLGSSARKKLASSQTVFTWNGEAYNGESGPYFVVVK